MKNKTCLNRVNLTHLLIFNKFLIKLFDVLLKTRAIFESSSNVAAGLFVSLHRTVVCILTFVLVQTL